MSVFSKTLLFFILSAHGMLEPTVETGVCQGTTLSECVNYITPETCLLMGCKPMFPPHTLPTHREMYVCTDEMKECKYFENNYECEYLAGCDWVYDDGSETSSPTEISGDRGIEFHTFTPTYSPTYSPTYAPTGLRFYTFTPTSTPSTYTSSPTSSPTFSDDSDSIETGTRDNVNSEVSSNSSTGRFISKMTFVLFVIPSIAFLF